MYTRLVYLLNMVFLDSNQNTRNERSRILFGAFEFDYLFSYYTTIEISSLSFWILPETGSAHNHMDHEVFPVSNTLLYDHDLQENVTI